MLDEKKIKEITDAKRNIIKCQNELAPEFEDYKTDQQLHRQQPPLCKAPMREESARVELPVDFSTLSLNNDLISIIKDRCSQRVYTNQEMTLTELSFLLWATQGVKSIRGKSYATLRTVPSGGARHPYETYLAVNNITGLTPGRYHYLPLSHELEYLGTIENYKDDVSESVVGQVWTAKANVVFYWAMMPYRAEWRYGIYAHPRSLIDAGHIGQNLYICCTALGIGTCGIAAFDIDKCDEMFELDGENEFMIYVCPVGTVDKKNTAEEQAFYKFVKEQGL